MKLLLISNSTNAGDSYLNHPREQIADFLGREIRKVLFFPYAAVTFSYDDYLKKVQERFAELGYQVDSIHNFNLPKEAVKQSDAIVVGGGNTWMLSKKIHELDLVDVLREKVLTGTPYIGWSAGANMACPTIMTTNDMPVADPRGFHAFHFVPFQINPHYLDANPEGHAGETRQQRIEEYITVNPDRYVVGLREGTMLLVNNNRVELVGKRPARIFRFGKDPIETEPGGDLNFVME